MAQAGGVILALNQTFLAIFVLELLLKVFAQRRRISQTQPRHDKPGFLRIGCG